MRKLTVAAVVAVALSTTACAHNGWVAPALVGGVVGAIVGGAIGNEVAKGPATVEQRQVCSYVPVTMQQGRIVTFNYQGITFTQQFSQ